MKKIILSLLALCYATVASSQTNVQKGAGNVLSNGSIVVGNATSITATGNGSIISTAGNATTVPWSGVTGTPTTLAGYGVTNTLTTTAPITGGGLLSGNLTLTMPAATGSVNGYLGFADWTTFNSKQPAGNYITALTGDGTATGPGNVTFTLGNITTAGTFGNATQVGQLMVNAKGLVTSGNNVTITPAIGSVTGLGAGVATLLTGSASGTGGPAGTTAPTFVNPILGNATATKLTSDYVLPSSEVSGLYIFPHYVLASNQMTMAVSTDGINIVDTYANTYVGPTGLCKDQSPAYINGAWYMVYTSADASGEFGVAKSSDLKTWVQVTRVTVGVAGNKCWAPEMLVDDDGSVNVVVALSTDGGVNFTIYGTHATSADLSTWSTPSVVFSEFNAIDAFLVKESGTYYLWYVNANTTPGYIEVASSSTVLGTYTRIKSGNWTGWGQVGEGICVVKRGTGDYLALVDYLGAGYYHYALSSSLLSGWGSMTVVNYSPLITGYAPKHGTMYAVKNAQAQRAVIGALGGRVATGLAGDNIFSGSNTFSGAVTVSGNASFSNAISIPGNTRQGVAKVYTASTGDMFGFEQASPSQTGNQAATRIFTSALNSSHIVFGKYTDATTFTEWGRFDAGGFFKATSIQNTPIGTTTPAAGAFTTLSATSPISFPGNTRQSVSVIYNAATGDAFGLEQASAAQTGNQSATRIFTSSAGNSHIIFGKYTSATAFTEWGRFDADSHFGITGNAVVGGNLSVTGNTTITGTLTPSQTNGIVGTTTTNNANAGSVGEFVSSVVAIGSPVSLTNATAANITSISLTAGDWDVDGNVNFKAATATVTGTSAGISSTSATLPTDGSEGYSGVQVTLLSEVDTVTLQRKRISISGTTTIYLVGKSTFSAGTVGGFGSISARRLR